MQIGDYKDKNELYQKIMDMRKALRNGETGSQITSLTNAMTAMRGMFGADNRFTVQSLERYVAVVISSGFVSNMDRLEKATEPLFTAGVDFISIGKGISR